MVSIDELCEVVHPKIQDGGDPPFWKSTWRHFSAVGGPIWIKFRRLVQIDMSTAVVWSKSKPEVEVQYGERLGEFNDMISEPGVTLQCERIPSAILKTVFRRTLLPAIR